MVDGKKVTKTVYLGRYDPETERITPKKERGPQRSKAEIEACKMEMTVIDMLRGMESRVYGSVHMLDWAQRETNLGRDLYVAFGPFVSKTIMGAAMALTLGESAFMHIEDTMQRTMIGQMYDLKGDFDSSSMSEFTYQIGSCKANIDDFFGMRVRACRDMLAWDSTTKGTHSKKNELADYLKYNKDDEDIPQVKKALACDRYGIPVMYRLYPGSMSDLATLKDFVDTVWRYGRKDVMLVMDRGYESGANIHYLNSLGADFVMPAKSDSKAVKSLMTEFKGRKNDRVVFDNHAYDLWETELAVVPSNRTDVNGDQSYDLVRIDAAPQDAERIKAYVCFDTEKQSNEIQNLRLMIDSISRRLEAIDDPDPMGRFFEIAGKAVNYFEAEAVDRSLSFRVRNNAVSFSENKAGMFVMLSSKGVQWEAMMSGYDARRLVEQNFDTDKGEDRRFRTGDTTTIEGREFIRFVSLIMRCKLTAAFRDYNGPNTSAGVLNTLSTVTAMGRDDVWVVSSPTKKARSLFEFVGATVPKEIVLDRVLCTPEQLQDAIDEGA